MAKAMASIQLNNVHKRFKYEWIFKQIQYTFQLGNYYALLGGNGSGKSTLMQIIAGSMQPSKGKVIYTLQDKTLNDDEIYKHISWAAPSLELIEELTLIESIVYQSHFKPFIRNFTPQDILAQIQLAQAKNKQIRYFSSGMKQRVKLALAILANTPYILLDEPTSNLDIKGITWYREMIQAFAPNRLVIVASNQAHEYDFCNKQLNIEDFKL